MRLGIFATTFVRGGLPETLDAVVESGLRTIQFNLGPTGGSSLPDEISAELAAQVRVVLHGLAEGEVANSVAFVGAAAAAGVAG